MVWAAGDNRLPGSAKEEKGAGRRRRPRQFFEIDG